MNKSLKSRRKRQKMGSNEFDAMLELVSKGEENQQKENREAREFKRSEGENYRQACKEEFKMMVAA